VLHVESRSPNCAAPADHVVQFPNPEGGKAIDVRRLLLNKCQEEFESGTQVSRWCTPCVNAE